MWLRKYGLTQNSDPWQPSPGPQSHQCHVVLKAFAIIFIITIGVLSMPNNFIDTPKIRLLFACKLPGVYVIVAKNKTYGQASKQCQAYMRTKYVTIAAAVKFLVDKLSFETRRDEASR